jgi:DNA polymerase (family 10)
MDLADDCLAELDIVIASVHSAFNQDESQMTERVLRAVECPWVDVIGHPTGRLILKRDGYPLAFDRVVEAAARHGVALEINCQIDRLDLDDAKARLARDRGVKLMINSDAHATSALAWLRWGTTVARRAWLERDDVLNTRPVDEFRASLRRARR